MRKVGCSDPGCDRPNLLRHLMRAPLPNARQWLNRCLLAYERMSCVTVWVSCKEPPLLNGHECKIEVSIWVESGTKTPNKQVKIGCVLNLVQMWFLNMFAISLLSTLMFRWAKITYNVKLWYIRKWVKKGTTQNQKDIWCKILSDHFLI